MTQVTETRDRLNEAWNHLADQVEEYRYMINSDRAFLNLCQDCLFTNEWIEEKLKVLKNHNWTHIQSIASFSRLQGILKLLKSDVKVIRAKVGDIGDRVTAYDLIYKDSPSERKGWFKTTWLPVLKDSRIRKSSG